MDNARGAGRLDELGEGRRVGHIHPDHAKGRVGLQPGRPRGFQRRIIIGVELIDPDDRLAPRQQSRTHRGADEPRRSRHDHSQERAPLCIRVISEKAQMYLEQNRRLLNQNLLSEE